MGGKVKLAEVTDVSSRNLPPVLLGHIGEDWDTKKTVRAIIATVTTFSTFTFSIDFYLEFPVCTNNNNNNNNNKYLLTVSPPGGQFTCLIYNKFKI